MGTKLWYMGRYGCTAFPYVSHFVSYEIILERIAGVRAIVNRYAKVREREH